MTKRNKKAKPVTAPTPEPQPARTPSAVPAALSMLDAAGIAYAPVPQDPVYIVADAFHFWPQPNFWKALDGSRQGYGVLNLVAAVRDNGYERAVEDALRSGPEQPASEPITIVAPELAHAVVQ